jgi:hypothetical protein
MSKKYSVDRVIGTKRCLNGGHIVRAEGYTIPLVKGELERYINCPHRFYADGAPLHEYQICGEINFTAPKFEVKMRPYKEWLNPLMKRMGK